MPRKMRCENAHRCDSDNCHDKGAHDENEGCGGLCSYDSHRLGYSTCVPLEKQKEIAREWRKEKKDA